MYDDNNNSQMYLRPELNSTRDDTNTSTICMLSLKLIFRFLLPLNNIVFMTRFI